MTEKREWINHIWTKQVNLLIDEGSRYDWEYKKTNSNFLRKKRALKILFDILKGLSVAMVKYFYLK